MKKAISLFKLIFIAVLCCVIMTACAGKQSNDEFRIVIHQNTDGTIYGIHYEYYLADTPIGGAVYMATLNDEVVPFEPGETVSLSFDKQFFPENSELSTFSLEIFVIDRSGNETKAADSIKLSPAYGNTYDYSLTGKNPNYSISEIDTSK